MLFKNIADLQKYGQVYATLWNGTNNLIANEIDDAEHEYLTKVISPEFYNILVAAYIASPATPLPNYLADILPLCQRITAEIATSLYIKKKGLLNIGAHGATQPGNNETRASSQWSINATANEYLKSGNKVIDRLLAFMEADKITYAVWAASTAYTEFKELLIFNASELSNYIPAANNSRLVYKSLAPYLRIAEDTISDCLGAPLFAEIKSQHLTNTTSANNQKLLTFIKPCIANIGYALGIKYMTVFLDMDGITTIDTTRMSGTIDAKVSAAAEQLQMLSNTSNNEANRLIAKLREYLIENAISYPLFVAPTANAGLNNLITDKVFRI
jgi:hypothetical protein